jgi:hypothetical protein
MWSDVELWSAHVTARLSNFCCRTRFVRRDVRVECSSTLLPVISRNGGNAYKKVRQQTFLYDTNSPDYRDKHMRANAWEDIVKELKIKRRTWREDSVSPALRDLSTRTLFVRFDHPTDFMFFVKIGSDIDYCPLRPNDYFMYHLFYIQ